jgi:Sulfotransferase family
MSSFNASTVSPIIIIGSPRSGTTLVARILEKLGLFVGSTLDGNHEAMFFQTLNDWFLHQSGGSWDNPDSIRYFLDDQENFRSIQQHVAKLMSAPRAYSFLGARKYLRYRDIRSLDIPWGWKDPRNTYTLLFWLSMFPQAKVIHVYRHGVDVARSLHHQCRSPFKLHGGNRVNRFFCKFDKFDVRRSFHPVNRGFKESFVCNSLQGSFNLWENHIETANQHLSNLGEYGTSIQFEELADNPTLIVERLANFSRLHPTEEQFSKAVGSIKPERRFAYKLDEPSNVLARDVACRLARYGYSG